LSNGKRELTAIPAMRFCDGCWWIIGRWQDFTVGMPDYGLHSEPRVNANDFNIIREV
jgi:hypothetical protein